MSSIFDAKNVARSNTGNVNEGLRNYMLSIYKIMAMGLATSGISAFLILSVRPLAELFFLTPLGTVALIANLGIAIFFFYGQSRITISTSKILFWVYSALTGISIARLGMVYTGESIFKVFFITASIFGAMSIYGYTTKRDLTSFQSFFVMGLIGIIIASLVNIFYMSSALQFMISFVAVFIFTGLVAYDTQKLKAIYYSVGGGEFGQRMAIVGAFSLYLDFINLFFHLLQLLGDRK